MVEIDKPVPEFTADTHTGTFNLKNQRGRQLVIYFYPKDATPGCTTEAQDFRDLHEAFLEANTDIVGVSRDSIASHQRFVDKQELPFELIADEDESVCRLFDVIHEKNLYGKKHMGIVRSTFLIDADGVLRREWRKVRVKGHAEEVLQAAREINQG